MASKRTQLNMAAFDELQQATARGMAKCLDTGARAMAAAVVDAPPHGEGLRYQWGWSAYVNGKKVDDGSADGSAVRPSRDMRVSRGVGLEGFVGLGFPGRFYVIGTSDTPPHPAPLGALMGVLEGMGGYIREAVAPLLGKP